MSSLNFLDVMQHAEDIYFNQSKSASTVDTINLSIKQSINEVSRLIPAQVSESDKQKVQSIANELDDLRKFKFEQEQKQLMELKELRELKIKKSSEQIFENKHNVNIAIEHNNRNLSNVNTIKHDDSEKSEVSRTTNEDLDLDEDVDQLVGNLNEDNKRVDEEINSIFD
jgi:hypothetical protein